MTWKKENAIFLFFAGLSLCLVFAPLDFAPLIGIIAAVIFIGMIIANTKMNRGKEKDA